jgi:hypothetical protein
LAEASTSPESKSMISHALAGSAGGLLAKLFWAASGGRAFAAARAFLTDACLIAGWLRAKDAEPGTKLAVTTERTRGRMEKFFVCIVPIVVYQG